MSNKRRLNEEIVKTYGSYNLSTSLTPLFHSTFHLRQIDHSLTTSFRVSGQFGGRKYQRVKGVSEVDK